MKKVFLSLVLLSASSITMFAQTAPQTERTQKAIKEKLDDKKKAFGRHGMNANEKAFEGIELTNEQKMKISAIQEIDNRAIKLPKKDNKEDSDKKDKKEKMTPEQMKQMREARGAQHQAARKEYLGQLKEILTPDQYVMFLENFFTLQEAPNGSMIDRGGKPIDRGMHRMKDMRSTKAEKKEITTD